MRLGHVTGIIMYKDIELCWFDANDYFVKYEPIGICKEYTPWEFREGYTAKAVLDWLYDRLPEDNRQGLEKRLQEYRINPIGEEIFKVSCGRALGDSCWIKFKDGPQTYLEVCKQEDDAYEF